MDSHLRILAARQADVVAAWQLRRAGWSWDKVEHHVESLGWRTVHAGVYALTNAPISRRQRWFAATLTAPGTVLSHGSAGACYGFHRFQRDFEVVTRPGQGGRMRCGSLLIFRSKNLGGREVRRHHRIPITTPERTLIDLAPGLNDHRLGRAFRESIRLKCATARGVRRALERHPGRPGTPRLRALATRYATIPYHRTRSDAEGRALEVLHDAGVRPPGVNEEVAGKEADLVLQREKRIIEIDGPQFHLFPDEDERKAEAWREAGYVVRRIPSDKVYTAPEQLLALCE